MHKCVCGGTGKFTHEFKGYVTIHPCPNESCDFDREKANREYEEWKRKGMIAYGLAVAVI